MQARGSLTGQVGALAYESPEQAKHLPYDGRNDVWALGCVVTEMLTGIMVFQRVKPGAVFALERDVYERTLAECVAISEDWCVRCVDIYICFVSRVSRLCNSDHFSFLFFVGVGS